MVLVLISLPLLLLLVLCVVVSVGIDAVVAAHGVDIVCIVVDDLGDGMFDVNSCVAVQYVVRGYVVIDIADVSYVDADAGCVIIVVIIIHVVVSKCCWLLLFFLCLY